MSQEKLNLKSCHSVAAAEESAFDFHGLSRAAGPGWTNYPINNLVLPVLSVTAAATLPGQNQQNIGLFAKEWLKPAKVTVL